MQGLKFVTTDLWVTYTDVLLRRGAQANAAVRSLCVCVCVCGSVYVCVYHCCPVPCLVSVSESVLHVPPFSLSLSLSLSLSFLFSTAGTRHCGRDAVSFSVRG